MKGNLIIAAAVFIAVAIAWHLSSLPTPELLNLERKAVECIE